MALAGLGSEVLDWVQQRWIGRPSLLTSAQPSQPVQSSISGAVVPTALFIGPARLQHEPLTAASSVAWHYDEFVCGVQQQFRVTQAQHIASLEYEIEVLEMVDFVSELATFHRERLFYSKLHSVMGRLSDQVTEHGTDLTGEAVGDAAEAIGARDLTLIQQQPVQDIQHDNAVSIGETLVGAAVDTASLEAQQQQQAPGYGQTVRTNVPVGRASPGARAPVAAWTRGQPLFVPMSPATELIVTQALDAVRSTSTYRKPTPAKVREGGEKAAIVGFGRGRGTLSPYDGS